MCDLQCYQQMHTVVIKFTLIFLKR